MQLIRTDNNVVLVEHAGKQIEWNVAIFDRTKYKKNDNIFSEINQYLSMISIQRQEKIFSIYQDIYEILNTSMTYQYMYIRLLEAVKELYIYVNIDELDIWYHRQPNIPFPTNVTETLSADLTSDKTYLRPQYAQLLVFTIALRLMVPIWGVYQALIADEVGSRYKEMTAIKIIGESALNTYAATDKLRTYVNVNIKPDKDFAAAILAGLGSMELIEWLFAGAVVKRLSVADIHEALTHGGLAKNIFGYVASSIQDMNMFGTFKSKFTEGGDDEEYSQIEKFRGKQMLTVGEIETPYVYLTQKSIGIVSDTGHGDPVNYVLERINPEDVLRSALSLDPTVPPDLVMSCIQTHTDHSQMEVTDFQINIAMLMYSKIMAPKAVLTLPKMAITGIVLIAAQAVLLHWGFYGIALMMMARVSTITDNTMGIGATQHRVTAETFKQLEAMFPYTIKANKTQNVRQANAAYIAINRLTELLPKVRWITRIPPIVDAVVRQNGLTENLYVPPHLPEQLGQFIIKINTPTI